MAPQATRKPSAPAFAKQVEQLLAHVSRLVIVAAAHRGGGTAAKVVSEDLASHRTKPLVCGGELTEHVCAAATPLDHLPNAPDLCLDAPQAREVCDFGGRSCGNRGTVFSTSLGAAAAGSGRTRLCHLGHLMFVAGGLAAAPLVYGNALRATGSRAPGASVRCSSIPGFSPASRAGAPVRRSLPAAAGDRGWRGL